MAFCVAPGCLHPQNADSSRFCQQCGAILLLKDRYLPVQTLQVGGFGRTFLAKDTHLPSQPLCVVKQLLGFQDLVMATKAKHLFTEEAVRLEELGDHPQIPKLFAHFEQQQQLYLVQEYVEGPTLTDVLRQQGPLDEEQIKGLLTEVAEILDFVHRRYIIHRDIKPSNILRRESDRRYVLIDFGIAKTFSEQDLGRTATIIGSPEYMAPEQMRGKVLPASDLFSLGVTCLFGMTLQSPTDLQDVAEDCWRWREQLPGDRTVSDRFARILNKLLATPVSQRYQSAAALLEDLRALEQPVAPSGPSLTQRYLGTRRVAPTPPPPPPDPLTSYLTQVNYDRLRKLLQTQQWEAADVETWGCLAEALEQPRGKYVAYGDLARIPCGDLAMVDVLWRKYSDSRFGFSKQADIFNELGRDYGAFCQQVGWPTHVPLQPYVQYKLSAPEGHLPSRRWVGGSSWWKHLQLMSDRLFSCGISY